MNEIGFTIFGMYLLHITVVNSISHISLLSIKEQKYIFLPFVWISPCLKCSLVRIRPRYGKQLRAEPKCAILSTQQGISQNNKMVDSRRLVKNCTFNLPIFDKLARFKLRYIAGIVFRCVLFDWLLFGRINLSQIYPLIKGSSPYVNKTYCLFILHGLWEHRHKICCVEVDFMRNYFLWFQILWKLLTAPKLMRWLMRRSRLS